MSEKWEYLTTFLEARVNKEKRAFIRARFPRLKRPPRFTPESLIPELDRLGDEGWELIHMEPVARIGGKGDVLVQGPGFRWSNQYFCVFKRPKRADTTAPPPGQSQPVETAQPDEAQT
jgi:hypothetical protein